MRRDELRDLAEQEKRLHSQMLQLDEDARKEKRSFTAEEQEQFDKLCTDFESVRETRTRAEKLFVQDRDVAQTLGTPIEKRVGDFADAPASFMEWKEQRNGGGRLEDQPEYRSAYWHYLGAQNSTDLDVEEHRALTKGTTTAGGYAVPTGFYNQLINISRFQGSMAQLANEIVTDSGETLLIPTITAHGTMSWTAESGSFTPSDETFGQASLGAYKGSTKIIVSEELLQDVSFDLEAYLANEFGERLGVGQNTAFIKGDGSAKPTGILQTAGTASNLGADVTAATGNATSFNYTALVTAIFSLAPQYRRGASFITADAGARNLYLLQDSQNRPLWNVNMAETGRTRSSATRSTPIRTCLPLRPATSRWCSATGTASTRSAVCAASGFSVRTSCTPTTARSASARSSGSTARSSSRPPASGSSTPRPDLKGDQDG
jgi:HK97 family phage major capsid protein